LGAPALAGGSISLCASFSAAREKLAVADADLVVSSLAPTAAAAELFGGPEQANRCLVLLTLDDGEKPPSEEALRAGGLDAVSRAELLGDADRVVVRALREAPLRLGLAQALAGRRQVERDLLEAERRLRDLAINEPGVIYQWSQRADGGFGFTYASPRIAELFHVAADRPNDALALIHPEDVPRWLASLDEVVRNPKPWSFEGRFLHPRDGSVRWWRATSRPTSITPEEILFNGILFDVTEEKEAEASLAAAHERLALALKGSKLTLWDWDLVSNQVYLSEQWANLLERETVANVIPAGELQELMHPEDAPRVLAAISAVRKGLLPDYSVEHRILSASGWKWISSHGMVTRRDGAGWAVRMTGTNADITERKVTETALAEAKAAAEAANRAKSDFLARMSHEIRTPLNGVLGLADLLGSTVLDSAQGEYVRRMRNAGQHLLALISNILDLAKIEAGKMEIFRAPFRLAPVVDGTLDVLRPAAESKGLRFALKIEPELPDWVEGDAVKLRQLLNNLVGNAIKFTASGTVETFVERSPRGAGWIRVRIVDSGPGFSGEERSRLFEPFGQLGQARAPRESGAGLGLAISRSLVALLDGEIGVESKEGEGSTFWFDLPLSGVVPPPESRSFLAPRRPGMGESRSGQRTLVVEDDEVSALVLRLWLEAMQCEVEVAGDGEEALRLAAAGRFDLILLDKQLPSLDGLEVARRVRALEAAEGRPAATLVLCTADAFRETEEEARAAGCDGYLTKPVDHAALEVFVRRSGPRD
jgi:signal transduction histidine kinase/CheY-like chemotaxis protein